MTKLIIVHPNVYDCVKNAVLMDSFNPDTTVIRYVDSMTKEDILNSIGTTEVTHFAFMYHFPGYESLPFFNVPNIPTTNTTSVSNDSPSDMTELMTSTIKGDKYLFYNDNVISLINSIKGHCSGKLIVDILSCSLSMPEYKEEVLKIESDLDIDIRFSTDLTGNPAEGRNWVMESELPSIVNVRDIYFTDNVLSWTGVLNNNITAAIKAGGLFAPYISWNATTKTFTLLQNIVWTSFVTATGINLTDYIAVNATEVFNGNNKTIDLTGVSNWLGLFISTGTDVVNLPRFINLGMINGTSLANSAGYIMRQDCRRFQVEDCYNTGLVNGAYSGGIAGYRAGYIGSAGVGKIYRSYNTGTITGAYAGGIAGFSVGNSSGILIIDDCYNTGAVSGIESGGITGPKAGEGSGNVTVSNCYNTGNITTDGSGGICSDFAGFNYGRVTITDCYNTGSLTGRYCGGIVGYTAGRYFGIVTITNCYNTGSFVGWDVGGIAGHRSGEDRANVTISKCYNSADITTPYAGGICGSVIAYNSGLVTVENCYNTGLVSTFAGGGIIGGQCGDTNGTVVVRNTFNTGNITQNGCGGILGNFAGNVGGTITVSKCYNIGNLIVNAAVYAGALTGSWTGANNGIVTIEDCYNTGNISGAYCGGICGADIARSPITTNTSTVTIRRCYNSGIKSATSGSVGGINVRNSPNGTLTIVDCVVNGGITGANAGSGITVTNTSTSITDISGAIVASWPTTTWATGTNVNINGISYALPILKVFQSSPWLSVSASIKYYSAANTRAYIYIPVTSVSIDGATSVYMMATTTLTATVADTDATDLSVTWSSLNSEIATVNSSGTVTGVSSGNATIRATSLITPGVYDDFEIAVPATTPVSAITINASQSSVHIGSSIDLTTSVVPSYATDTSVTWSALNAFASVNSSGTVNGVAAGIATIEARSVSDSTVFATIDITVTVPVTSVTINSDVTSVMIGETISLSIDVQPNEASNTDVTWSSSNDAIASVNTAGVVLGKSSGTVTITVTSVSTPGISDTIDITSFPYVPVTDITPLTMTGGLTNTSLYVGSTATMSASAIPSEATNPYIRFRSSHPEILSIDRDTGEMSALQITTTPVTITADSNLDDNKSRSINITVLPIPVTSLDPITTTGNVTRLASGGTLQFTSTANPPTASNRTITWSVRNTDNLITTPLATIDSDGLVTAASNVSGQIQVIARSESNPNILQSINIFIFTGPTGVTITNTNVNITTVETDSYRIQNKAYTSNPPRLTATVEPADTSNKKVKWTSLTPSVATISESLGTITAVSVGTTTLRAEADADSSIYKEVTLEVVPVLTTSITINNIPTLFYVTSTATLTATTLPGNAVDSSVTWSSNSANVTVDETTGVITGVSAGSATITATASDGSGVTGIATITVLDIPVSRMGIIDLTTTSGISLASQTTLRVGAEAQLIVEIFAPSNTTPPNDWSPTVTWSSNDFISSSNPTITYDSNTNKFYAKCTINALAISTTAQRMTATSGSIITSKSIQVQSVPITGLTNISSTGNVSRITIGSQLQLSSTIEPNNASEQTITWSIDNNALATIDSNGLLTANSTTAGKVTVRASAGGFNRSRDINIYIPVSSVTIENNTNSVITTISTDNYKILKKLYLGASAFLNATILPSNATTKGIIWSSLDEDIATVNELTGIITPKLLGTARIIATSAENNTIYKQVSITVAPVKVSSIKISGAPSTGSIFKSETLSLTTTVLPGDAENSAITWSSSNENIATVSSTGLVTGVNGSTDPVTITATANDGSGVTNSITLRVNDIIIGTVGAMGLATLTQSTIKGRIIGINSTVYGKVQLSPPKNITAPANWSPVVNWTTSDETYISISEPSVIIETGKYFAIAKLTGNLNTSSAITITATPAEGTARTSKNTFTVAPIRVSKVAITGSIAMSTNGQSTYTALITPNNATYTDVTWSIANDKGFPAEPLLATIDETTGVVTSGSNIGGVIITATSADIAANKKAIFKVSINEPATDITITSITNAISTGTDENGYDTYTIYNDPNKKSVVNARVIPSTANKSYLLTSSNTDAITTSSNIISSKSIGTSTIRVMSATNNSVYKEIKVTVLPAVVSSITLKQAIRGSLSINQTSLITPNILPKTAENKDLTWTVSDESKVTIINPTNSPYVTTNGGAIMIKAIAAGLTQIIATSNNNVVVKLNVSVR